MKDIHELLKDQDIEIKDKDAFDKAFRENYKTIAEHEKTNDKLKALQAKYDEDIKSRDKELEDLKTQLGETEGDKESLADVQKKLTDLQETHKKDKEEWEKKLADQEYEYAVKDATRGLKFSSNSAKEQFTRKLVEQELKVQDGTLLGLDDFVNKYKEEDAGAFADEAGEDKPHFASKTSGGGSGDTPGAKEATPIIGMVR